MTKSEIARLLAMIAQEDTDRDTFNFVLTGFLQHFKAEFQDYLNHKKKFLTDSHSRLHYQHQKGEEHVLQDHSS